MRRLVVLCITSFLEPKYADLPINARERHGGARLVAIPAALLATIGMFYRYLKFFREYTVEVFRSYAESEEQGKA